MPIKLHKGKIYLYIFTSVKRKNYYNNFIVITNQTKGKRKKCGFFFFSLSTQFSVSFCPGHSQQEVISSGTLECFVQPSIWSLRKKRFS